MKGVWLLPRAFVWGAGGGGSGGKCGWRTPPTLTPGAARLGAAPQWAWHWGATIGEGHGAWQREGRAAHAPPTHTRFATMEPQARAAPTDRRLGSGGVGLAKGWTRGVRPKKEMVHTKRDSHD